MTETLLIHSRECQEPDMAKTHSTFDIKVGEETEKQTNTHHLHPVSVKNIADTTLSPLPCTCGPAGTETDKGPSITNQFTVEPDS